MKAELSHKWKSYTLCARNSSTTWQSSVTLVRSLTWTTYHYQLLIISSPCWFSVRKATLRTNQLPCGIQHVSGALLPAVDWPAFKNYKWILIRACGEKKNTIMVINLQESYHELKTLYKCFLDYLSLGITYAMISSMTVDNWMLAILLQLEVLTLGRKWSM